MISNVQAALQSPASHCGRFPDLVSIKRLRGEQCRRAASSLAVIALPTSGKNKKAFPSFYITNSQSFWMGVVSGLQLFAIFFLTVWCLEFFFLCFAGRYFKKYSSLPEGWLLDIFCTNVCVCIESHTWGCLSCWHLKAQREGDGDGSQRSGLWGSETHQVSRNPFQLPSPSLSSC